MPFRCCFSSKRKDDKMAKRQAEPVTDSAPSKQRPVRSLCVHTPHAGSSSSSSNVNSWSNRAKKDEQTGLTCAKNASLTLHACTTSPDPTLQRLFSRAASMVIVTGLYMSTCAVSASLGGTTQSGRGDGAARLRVPTPQIRATRTHTETLDDSNDVFERVGCATTPQSHHDVTDLVAVVTHGRTAVKKWCSSSRAFHWTT